MQLRFSSFIVFFFLPLSITVKLYHSLKARAFSGITSGIRLVNGTPGRGEKLGRGGWSCFHTGSVLLLPGKGEKATETGAIRRGGATATGATQRVGATTAEVVVLEEEMAL